MFIEWNNLEEFYLSKFKLYSSQLNLLLKAWRFVKSVSIFDNELLDKEPIRAPLLYTYESDPDTKDKENAAHVSFKSIETLNLSWNHISEDQFRPFILDLIGPWNSNFFSSLTFIDMLKNLKVNFSDNFDEFEEKLMMREVENARKVSLKVLLSFW